MSTSITAEGALDDDVNFDGNHCGWCGVNEEEKKLLRCSACFAVLYCCKEHQKSDWANHKLLCKELKHLLLDNPAILRLMDLQSYAGRA